jgi:hypothetical protein
LEVLQAEASTVGIDTAAGKSQRFEDDATTTAPQLVGEAIRRLYDLRIRARIACSGQRHLRAAIDARRVPQLAIEAPIARALRATHEETPLAGDRALALRATVRPRLEVRVLDHDRHVDLRLHRVGDAAHEVARRE